MKQTPSASFAAIAIGAIFATLALAGCAEDSDNKPGATAVATAALPTAQSDPVGVIALGHSGLTGENSDPARPGSAAKINSWATGTNPEAW